MVLIGSPPGGDQAQPPVNTDPNNDPAAAPAPKPGTRLERGARDVRARGAARQLDLQRHRESPDLALRKARPVVAFAQGRELAHTIDRDQVLGIELGHRQICLDGRGGRTGAR